MKVFWSVTLGCVLLLGCRSHRGGIVDYPTPYQNPLNSPGGKFGGLPPAVQNTVRAQTGAEPIYDIRKDTSSEMAIYQIYFENLDVDPLFVASDGSVLNPDMTVAVGAAREDIGVLSGGASGGLKPSDLPPAVMKIVQEKAPNTEIAIIEKTVIDGRDVFTVAFKDPARAPTLTIAADGTLIDASKPKPLAPKP